MAVSGGIALVLSILLSAAPASATVRKTVYKNGNTNNPVNALELFYNSNSDGAGALFVGEVSDYAGYDDHCDDNTVCYNVYVFSSSGNGAGQVVKNNAASAYNISPIYNYTVYYNHQYTGPSQTIPGPYSAGNPLNFNSTLKNQNASQRAFYIGG
jgi:hypothetical protein